MPTFNVWVQPCHTCPLKPLLFHYFFEEFKIKKICVVQKNLKTLKYFLYYYVKVYVNKFLEFIIQIIFLVSKLFLNNGYKSWKL
jgi:hypothetical protein